MADNVPQELVTRAYDALTALTEYPTMKEQNLTRPPAKIIQEIFTSLSNATGFPDPAIIQEKEIPKDQKEERIRYIQLIIDETAKFLGQDIPCEAKNITAGKAVEQTLYFLMKLAEACRLKKASDQGPVEEPKAPEPVIEAPKRPAPMPVQEEAPKRPVPMPVQEEAPKPEPVKKEVPAPVVEPEEPVRPVKMVDPVEPEIDVIGAPPADPFGVQEPAYAPKPAFVDDKREIQRAAQRQEDELREYEEARRVQEKDDAELQRKTQEVLGRLPTAGEKVQPVVPRRQQKDGHVAAAGYQVKILLDEESDDKQAGQQADEGESIAAALGLGGDSKLAGLFDAVPASAQGGAFTADAQQAADSYALPRSSEDKNRVAAQRVSNQANSKLVAAVQDAVRQVIPFSKATSFLEEHLVRMRQELLQAVDDCHAQEQARQRYQNLENKSRSVLDARLRSVQEQLATAKQSLAELSQQVFL